MIYSIINGSLFPLSDSRLPPTYTTNQLFPIRYPSSRDFQHFRSSLNSTLCGHFTRQRLVKRTVPPRTDTVPPHRPALAQAHCLSFVLRTSFRFFALCIRHRCGRCEFFLNTVAKRHTGHLPALGATARVGIVHAYGRGTIEDLWLV